MGKSPPPKYLIGEGGGNSPPGGGFSSMSLFGLEKRVKWTAIEATSRMSSFSMGNADSIASALGGKCMIICKNKTGLQIQFTNDTFSWSSIILNWSATEASRKISSAVASSQPHCSSGLK